MAIDLEKIDLRKKTIIDLKKKAGIEDQKAQVVLALDFSGSMSHLYSDGTVQETVERILPLGLVFDDNKEVDFYLFENGCKKMPNNITLSNLDGYINKKVIGKYMMGGTSYAPVLKTIFEDFSTTKGGFLGIGGKKTKMQYPVYIIFITDGENDDKTATEMVIKEMSEYGFFIQFVGIGREYFNFLRKLDDLTGRALDNANFFSISNLAATPDDQLYSDLMKEFPSWVKDARSAGFID